MSESTVTKSIPDEILKLAELACIKPGILHHEILDSRTEYPGPGFQNVFQLRISDDACLIVTSIEVKTLYDIADAAFTGGDFRATNDLNPYQPFAGGGSDVGQAEILVDGQGLFATAYDFGVINRAVLFVFDGSTEVVIRLDPRQPAGKKLVLVTAVNAYSAPRGVVPALSPFRSSIITKV